MVREKLHPLKTFLLPAVLGALLLSSCDVPEYEPAPDLIQFDSSASDVLISAPLRLRSIRDINLEDVRAVILLNSEETELRVNAEGQFGGQVTVPAGSRVEFSIEFFELYGGQRLMLAKSEQSIDVGNQDTTLNLSRSDYTFDQFDDDGDGVSNIIERENDTSPLDAAQLPDLVTVEVFASPPLIATAAGYNAYQLEVTVGSTTFATAAQVGQFSHTFTVARQEPLNVELRLIESQTDQQLTIGTQSKQLTNLQDYTTVSFDADAYNLAFDQDDDGARDLDELIAGTDVFTADTSTDQIAFTVTFPIPAEILSLDNTYATLLVDGRNINLLRSDDAYSGTAIVEEGATVFLEVSINDSYQGSVVVLATTETQLSPLAGQSFGLDDFYILHDADEDGILNYEEMLQGSDPYNSPVVQCTETIDLELAGDAFVNGMVLFDTSALRVDRRNRVSFMSYLHDVSSGEVTSAELKMTMGTDQGTGEIVVYVVPDFEWNAASVLLSLPELDRQVGSLDEDWNSGDEYFFDIDPTAVTSNFTLFLQQQDGNDVAFESSEGEAPPVLQVTVDRC